MLEQVQSDELLAELLDACKYSVRRYRSTLPEQQKYFRYGACVIVNSLAEVLTARSLS